MVMVTTLLAVAGCGGGIGRLVRGEATSVAPSSAASSPSPLTSATADPGSSAIADPSSTAQTAGAERLPLGAVAGPFGRGSHGHLDLTVTQVTVSDLALDQWGQKGTVIPDDEQARNVFVGIELQNKDPNDEIRFVDDRLILLVEGKPIVAQRVNRGSDFSPSIRAQDTVSHEYGFEVGRDVRLAGMQLRYEVGTVPVLIPLRAGPPAPSTYPVAVTPPKPGKFVGSLNPSCKVTWTLQVTKARLDLDMPSRLDAPGPVNNRAPARHRWLVLDTDLRSGPANCLSPQGVFTPDSVRLVVDGKPVSPSVAPTVTLLTDDRVTSVMVWPISTTAGSQVALRGIGPRGSTFERPFVLPAMPALPGEST
jgi:hypothetical protein